MGAQHHTGRALVAAAVDAIDIGDTGRALDALGRLHTYLSSCSQAWHDFYADVHAANGEAERLWLDADVDSPERAAMWELTRSITAARQRLDEIVTLTTALVSD